MESEVKVFHSEISRVDFSNESNLYELLKITPAQPVLQQTYDSKNETWEFLAHEKHYVPRKGSKLKVQTVRDIRALFEKDVYNYLPDDLDKQRHYLLRKIRDGSSYEKKTIETATKLLNSDTPISRTAWQMLANINPENHNHSKQFVLWNGKSIQVNGSRGGKTKFICNYDLKQKKTPLKNKCTFKKKVSRSRLGLLRNSLNVKFKPGPLGKKKILDSSHQKYQMGGVELVKLPTPVLEISTAYGIVLEPTISNFINDLRGDKGVISQKLAEFAVSTFGMIKDNTPVQLEKKCITFDLNYKCGQNRLLMRRSVADTTFNTNIESYSKVTDNFKSKSITTQNDVENSTKHVDDESVSEIKKMMFEILGSIEISIEQDSMFITEDESKKDNVLDDIDLTTKDKFKRKYCELDKLDVTIIKLPQSSEKDYTKPCGKSFCTLGCICESIDCPFSLKQHCGVLDCMFGCKCEVPKYKSIEFLVERDCSDMIPGLLNLDNEINSHLAKEEQKFHQTVIVSGEKSILLKSQKRNLKSSKKYAEFYSKMNLKGDENIKKIVTVDVTKLNCENIEPFCMVHSLYKCFCKGKFIDSYIINNNVTENNVNKTLNIEETKVTSEVIADGESSNSSTKLRLRRSCYERAKNISITETSEVVQSRCARTMVYQGRKYNDDYYKNTNNKILEMEKDDNLLKKKMSRLLNSTNDDILQTLKTSDVDITTKKNDAFKSNICNVSSESDNDALNKTVNTSGKISNPFVTTKGNNSFKHWLEISYKSYKEKLEQGLLKNSLGAPKKGKAALQTWDFILSRYRERKNIFFVSRQVPFRTFLAVDENHPFFSNCINIDDIRFADLPKYPLIIRNLVTNATDSENSFCILRGFDHYWELIGSAVKVIEGTAESQLNSEEPPDTGKLNMQNESENDNWIFQKTLFSLESTSSSDSKDFKSTEQDDPQDRSKWFIMTVENDFTEIQFYKKGFYVTYDGIQQTIALARNSGKTVRLSSGARTDKNSTYQFGIYAVPCINECCVFIGPYEVDEPLGIEVVKTFLDPRKVMKTRGVWITTNKIDNMKVLEHPLSFLPTRKLSNDAMVHIDSSFNPVSTEQSEASSTDENVKGRTTTTIVLKRKSGQEISKVIKPIKIQRTNGFYHLSNSILQKLPVNKKSVSKPITISKSAIVNKNSLPFMAFGNSGESNTPQKPVAEVAPHVINTEESSPISPGVPVRPVAEIAPQIKIASVYSEAHLQNKTVNSEKTSCSNMLILRPDEINKKILANTVLTEQPATDVEKFLESSTICVAPKEVLVISDGEDDETEPWRMVFIQCWNVDNFGWLRGRINVEKFLSFEFPGFKYSDFYEENEAFEKINQVLARKIYIPKTCNLQWQVILDEEFLTCDMLTPACLEDKKYLLIRLREHREKKAKLRKPKSTKKCTKKNNSVKQVTTASSFNENCVEQSQRRRELEDLEQASKELEQQREVFWKRAITKREEIMVSLSVPDNLKTEMTEKLQDIMSMNKL